jgi:hypothetical protein
MHVLIIGDSQARVWGLTGRERLRRQLARVPSVEVVEPGAALPGTGEVLLIHAGHLHDPRLLRALSRPGDALALIPAPGRPPVAARCDASDAPAIGQELSDRRLDGLLAGLPHRLPGELVTGFERSLRKVEPPVIYAIAPAVVPQLEAELFGGAYKGVTDFITKWLWPVPAMHVTRWCVQRGWSPNQVTACGLVLAILAGLAFWQGYFGTGLLLGWIMTFLDTVDGKLARVTVTSSRFGNVLDHGIDLVHPPLWYAAWGMGLSDVWTGPVSIETLLWAMFAGYLGGRLCEGLFHLWIGRFSMFLWQPLDSFNRLITARRNPNLMLLTIAWLAGSPAIGLWAVVVWHVFSTLFLLCRALQGWRVRSGGRTLQPWLELIDPVRDRHRLAVRVFTRVPAEIHVDPAGA